MCQMLKIKVEVDRKSDHSSDASPMNTLVISAMARSFLPGPYPILSTAIAGFMRTGVSPIASQESVEVIAFLEAASRSHAAGGRRVTLAELDK